MHCINVFAKGWIRIKNQISNRLCYKNITVTECGVRLERVHLRTTGIIRSLKDLVEFCYHAYRKGHSRYYSYVFIARSEILYQFLNMRGRMLWLIVSKAAERSTMISTLAFLQFKMLLWTARKAVFAKKHPVSRLQLEVKSILTTGVHRSFWQYV